MSKRGGIKEGLAKSCSLLPLKVCVHARGTGSSHTPLLLPLSLCHVCFYLFLLGDFIQDEKLRLCFLAHSAADEVGRVTLCDALLPFSVSLAAGQMVRAGLGRGGVHGGVSSIDRGLWAVTRRDEENMTRAGGGPKWAGRSLEIAVDNFV